jgi:hypothetical protein
MAQHCVPALPWGRTGADPVHPIRFLPIDSVDFLSACSTRPEKNWKFAASDVKGRAFWKDSMAAYEDVLTHTSTAWAPWNVIPADNQWFTRLAGAAVVVEKMKEIDPHYPTVSEEHKKGLLEAKRTLEKER